MAEAPAEAFVTLATNDAYCAGALVLGHTLKHHGTTRKTVVLITPQVSSGLRAALSRVFDEVAQVDVTDSGDDARLAVLSRPELGVTLTKLHCWALTHYGKGVFLDADTMVLCNIEELFDREELSAAPDPGWPDCFNSGVFVFRPSLETHGLLLRHAAQHGSFDGADQGLLNSFFSDWSTGDIRKHLPFLYNMSVNTAYTYRPAFQQFGSSAKVIHFLGPSKPWNFQYDPQTGCVSGPGAPGDSDQQALLSRWWRIYHDHVLPLCDGVRDAAEHASPGHSDGMLCMGVSYANEAPSVQEPYAKSAASIVQEPCVKSAVGAEVSCANSSCVPSAAEQVVRNDVPPTSDRCQSPEMFGGSETGDSPPGTCEPGLADCSGLIGVSSPLEYAPVCADPLQVETEEPLEPPRPAVDSMPNAEVAVAMRVTEPSPAAKEPDPQEGRRKWEEGRIDYLGKDAFAYIQQKLDRFLH